MILLTTANLVRQSVSEALHLPEDAILGPDGLAFRMQPRIVPSGRCKLLAVEILEPTLVSIRQGHRSAIGVQ
jgi:hypothetical protein